jgi:hypothetical protein
LYLGGSSSRMTLPVLRRLASLVEAGATVVGAAPKQSPSLKDDANEFRSIAQRLWGSASTTTVGKGKVIAGSDVEGALRSLGVAPDFSIDKAGSNTEVLFVHRRIADGDAYFLSNAQNRAENIDARFRVAGKKAEIWRAESGTAQPVSYRIDGTTTVVPLEMLPNDSFFVVFRAPVKGTGENVRKITWSPVSKIDGAWDVAFQPGRAAPEKTRLASLASFHTNADPAIKYFSGTATYRRTFTLPSTVKPGSSVMLDLGQVGDVAEVLVNGQAVGFAWKAPYRVDVSKAVRAGNNDLEVRVVNLWVNRLIGDAQPGANKITFTTLPTYRPDAPLRPSGLIGPVTVLAPQSSPTSSGATGVR